MQTSQLQDLDTHVVLGGGELQDFQMAASAEAFTVLSDTLYQDKPRACVREVLCNAWDAHIKAGKTDVPVEVTITDEDLTITDVGPGIPHDAIRTIYCTYFNSTKAEDGTQTGGFGLGSKAPFAVADHFTVTNSHGGKRAVYAVSRGGTETGGKPGFRAMVETPSIATGVSVTVPLMQDRMTRHQARDLVEEIAWQGGMNVTLNGKQVRAPDFAEARKTGYAVIPASHLGKAQLYVAYGAVMYPVNTTVREIAKPVEAIDQRLNGYRGHQAYPKTVVLFAPPNSIGVTPAREALSYTDRTQATILRLLKRLEADLKRLERKVARECVIREMAKLNDPLRDSPNRLQLGDIATTPQSVAEKFAQQSGVFRNKRLVQRARARLLPDLRRSLRHGHGAERINDRLVRRLVAKAGLLDRLYSFEPRVDTFTKFARISARHERHLIVAPTQRSACELKLPQRAEWPRTQCALHYPTIVIPNLTQEQRRQIIELGFTYGYRVTFAERAKPVPKPEPLTRTWFHYGESQHNWQEEITAKYFVVGSYSKTQGWDHYLKGEQAWHAAKACYGDIIRIQNQTEAKQLERLGLRLLKDVVAEEVEANQRSRALLWGFATSFNVSASRLSRLWPQATDKVKKIVEAHPEHMGVFYPAPKLREKNAERMINLGRFVGHAVIGNPYELLTAKLRDNPFVPDSTKLPDPAAEFLASLDLAYRASWTPENITGVIAGIRAIRALKKD